MLLTPPPFPPVGGTSLINELSNLGLLTNLKVCLDAGDVNSYDGTSQTWKDLSGNGTDFYRGSTSSAQASDPTFNGTAGRQSSGEYFSLDGGDWFTITAQPSWADAFHKANAQFTVAMAIYLSGVTSTAVNFGGIGDVGPSGAWTGLSLESATGAFLRSYRIQINNASKAIYSKTSSNAAVNNAWNFLAASVDIQNGNVLFQINGTTETYTGQSYSGSPVAGVANSVLQIGAGGDGAGPDATGIRYGNVSMWSRALSGAELGGLYNATKGKFGF